LTTRGPAKGKRAIETSKIIKRIANVEKEKPGETTEKSKVEENWSHLTAFTTRGLQVRHKKAKGKVGERKNCDSSDSNYNSLPKGPTHSEGGEKKDQTISFRPAISALVRTVGSTWEGSQNKRKKESAERVPSVDPRQQGKRANNQKIGKAVKGRKKNEILNAHLLVSIAGGREKVSKNREKRNRSVTSRGKKGRDEMRRREKGRKTMGSLGRSEGAQTERVNRAMIRRKGGKLAVFVTIAGDESKGKKSNLGRRGGEGKIPLLESLCGRRQSVADRGGGDIGVDHGYPYSLGK